jgi:hypothetical protein
MNEYKIDSPTESGTISFVTTNDPCKEPILKITEEGFFVRGIKVPADDKEASTVYNIFKRFLVEAELKRPY